MIVNRDQLKLRSESFVYVAGATRRYVLVYMQSVWVRTSRVHLF